jgi:formate dehydrogenase subunit beta
MAVQEPFKVKHSLIKVKDNLIKSLNAFFKDILEGTDIEAILIPKELPTGTGFIPALITKPESLAAANALAPIMPVNASKALSDYTRLKPSSHKLAVVLRPCEHRAAIELAKLKQIYLDNVIIIGIDCPGTFSIQTYAGSKDKKKDKLTIESLIKSMEKLEDHSELRSACQVCEFFAPHNVDISIGLHGLDTAKKFLVSVNTSSADAIMEPLKLSYDSKDTETASNKRRNTVDKLKKRRLEETQKLEEATQKRISGLENFMTELSACINCHNCMEVCPICYCRECFFDSPTFNLESEKYFKMADRKGSLRMPSNMFLFHVTRFNHMVLSCIACGMCEQGCPADIPLMSIYKTVGRKAQEVFDYEPGRSLEEEIPILTFKEDELEPK